MSSMRTAAPLGLLLAATLFSASAFAAEQGHFHHLHMNVADVARTTKFYQQVFGVAAIQYNNRMPSLLMERSFLFMNRMDAARIGNHQLTGLTHGCWATEDGPHTFQWLKSKGVEFYTPIEEFTPGTTYMYKQGVEIVRPMTRDEEYGFRHFFVRAPNGVLVELVEARPWPEAAWER